MNNTNPDKMITKEEKEEVLEHLNKAFEILNKYPIVDKANIYSVTSMSRAKSGLRKAIEWTSYLGEWQ